MREAVSVIICINRRYGINSPSCAARGAEAIADDLEKRLGGAGLNIPVKRIECLGQCERGPTLRIAPGGEFFHEVDPNDLPAVVARLVQLSE